MKESGLKTPITNVKVDVENFDVRNNLAYDRVI